MLNHQRHRHYHPQAQRQNSVLMHLLEDSAPLYRPTASAVPSMFMSCTAICRRSTGPRSASATRAASRPLRDGLAGVLSNQTTRGWICCTITLGVRVRSRCLSQPAACIVIFYELPYRRHDEGNPPYPRPCVNHHPGYFSRSMNPDRGHVLEQMTKWEKYCYQNGGKPGESGHISSVLEAPIP